MTTARVFRSSPIMLKADESGDLDMPRGDICDVTEMTPSRDSDEMNIQQKVT